MNMSRGSMLLWLIVTVFVFTLAPSIAKKDSKLNKLKSMGKNMIPEWIKEKRMPDFSEPIGYVKKKANDFGDFLIHGNWDMKKSSLKKRHELANNVEDSYKGQKEYKAALTEAIAAKEKLEDAEADLESASLAEKDKFQAVVDNEQKNTKAKVLQVHQAQINMRKLNTLHRPFYMYSRPLVILTVLGSGYAFINRDRVKSTVGPNETNTPVTYDVTRATNVTFIPLERFPINTILTIAFAIMLVIVITVAGILFARRFGLISSERSNSTGVNNKEPFSKAKMKKKPKGTGNQHTSQANEAQFDTYQSGDNCGDSRSSGTNTSSTTPTDAHHGNVKS